MKKSDWKILIIDEDTDFFDWAKSELNEYRFENHPIQLSYVPVQDMVARTRESDELQSIVIGLTSNNKLMCLELVRYIRTVLKNQTTRILLIYDKGKTIPDESFLEQYDISEIRTRKGLTAIRWRILVRNVLKSYVSKQREVILDSVYQISHFEKGASYLQSMIRNLGKTLGYKYTFLGVVNENRTRIQTRAVWGNGKFMENFEYALEHTPCGQVLTGNRVCIHPQGVVQAYPNDKLLQELEVESYMGCPIILPDGELMGLLVALDSRPMKETGIHRPILEFFAERAGVEFERELHQTRMEALNSELEAKVKDRTEELKQSHETMLELAHKAGMAEIASGVLHNVGNVLNSITTSADLLDETLNSSELPALGLANTLISENSGSLDVFFTTHPKGKNLPDFFLTMERVLTKERDIIKRENGIIRDNAAIINQVIKTQQAYAGKDGILIQKNVASILDHTLEMMRTSLERHKIKVVKRYEETPPVPIHKTRMIQILTNLIKNAKEAMLSQDPSNRTMVLSISRIDGHQVLSIQDNGEGIEERHMEKLFNFGFTTKKDGNGFGLHSSFNFIQQIGGDLKARSKGKGRGAEFTLTFPEAVKTSPANSHQAN